MRRLFYKGRLAEEIVITGGDAAHLLYALRGKKGDVVTVVDDVGATARYELAGFSPDTVTLHLLERIAADTEPPIHLTLAQCLLKGEKMELTIQKAVELGVTEICPLAAQNSVARYDAKKAAAKETRWQKIADEAAKQCGRTRLVRVAPIVPLGDWLAAQTEGAAGDGAPQGVPQAALLFCYENEQHLSIKKALRDLPEGIEKFAALIGPEGGFTLAEAEKIERAGGIAVTLGPRILRAETAAIAAMSVIQYEKGDL